MRELTSHKTGSDLNESINVVVLDDPGLGGANYNYEISVHGNWGAIWRYKIRFQKGACKDKFNGVNGISDEALLAIVEDRLAGFQDGPFACEENEQALDHVRMATERLRRRTRHRSERGVEGRYVK